MAAHNNLGKEGELQAVRYLQESNYTIVECNWRYNKHEIDIIARNKEYIVFIEVKTRSSDKWGEPEDAVSAKQMKRIVEAADFYLIDNDINEPARFDIISIIGDKDQLRLRHIEDAFRPFL